MDASLREKLLATLRDMTIAEVVAHYSGYADAGSIESLTPDLSDHPFDSHPHCWKPEIIVDRNLSQALQDLFHSLLPQGWETNDGADGTITWDITRDRITIEHGAHYTETRREWIEL